MQVLFSFEGQMSLFLRMSSSETGSYLLLECGITEALSELRFLGNIPEIDLSIGNADIILTLSVRILRRLFATEILSYIATFAASCSVSCNSSQG